MITGSLEEGGLGFDLKWNMGFMNDYLDYIKYDPYFRSHHHGELTFSMIYAYSEKFMLVFPMMKWYTAKELCLVKCLETGHRSLLIYV